MVISCNHIVRLPMTASLWLGSWFPPCPWCQGFHTELFSWWFHDLVPRIQSIISFTCIHLSVKLLRGFLLMGENTTFQFFETRLTFSWMPSSAQMRDDFWMRASRSLVCFTFIFIRSAWACFHRTISGARYHWDDAGKSRTILNEVEASWLLD